MSTTETRALTLRAPWGALIASGTKTVENRLWSTKYRGLVAIHTGQGVDRDAMRRVMNPDGVGDFLHDAFAAIERPLPTFGHILAIARIDDCHPYEPGCCTSLWAEPVVGVWHWCLADVRALPKPIPAKGRLGLWKPDAALVGQITTAGSEAC